MNRNPDELERKSGIPSHPERAAIATSIAAGALAGIAVGIFAFAGPIVVVSGGVIGGVAGGAIATLVRSRSKRQDAKDATLDRELGVIGGDIGGLP
jgi:hypothetical protein